MAAKESADVMIVESANLKQKITVNSATISPWAFAMATSKGPGRAVCGASNANTPATVDFGEPVERGQQIGTIGTNRRMYYAYLHFEIWKKLGLGFESSQGQLRPRTSMPLRYLFADIRRAKLPEDRLPETGVQLNATSPRSKFRSKRLRVPSREID